MVSLITLPYHLVFKDLMSSSSPVSKATNLGSPISVHGTAIPGVRWLRLCGHWARPRPRPRPPQPANPPPFLSLFFPPPLNSQTNRGVKCVKLSHIWYYTQAFNERVIDLAIRFSSEIFFFIFFSLQPGHYFFNIIFPKEELMVCNRTSSTLASEWLVLINAHSLVAGAWHWLQKPNRERFPFFSFYWSIRIELEWLKEAVRAGFEPI